MACHPVPTADRIPDSSGFTQMTGGTVPRHLAPVLVMTWASLSEAGEAHAHATGPGSADALSVLPTIPNTSSWDHDQD